MESSAPESIDASHYPKSIVPVGHSEPAPRRLRGVLDGRVVLDTTRAHYVWEIPHYPQYYVPAADVDAAVLESLRGAGRVRDGDPEQLPGTVRIEWGALDEWFEEDEKVLIHPRSPYSRVDAVRSSRGVRIELEGVILAESPAPVMLFETGLPTRYYLDRHAIDFGHLVPTETLTGCPYKGWTSQYWSVQIGERVHTDLAWSYDFPTLPLAPIAGLVAFYGERVDVFIDGVPLVRPRTPFSD
ncbi:MAG: DUF427 domain-containing protein [Solirubrobacterales bacterium]